MVTSAQATAALPVQNGIVILSHAEAQIAAVNGTAGITSIQIDLVDGNGANLPPIVIAYTMTPAQSAPVLTSVTALLAELVTALQTALAAI